MMALEASAMTALIDAPARPHRHQDNPAHGHNPPVTVILGRFTVILGRFTVILGRFTVILGRFTVILGLDPRISRYEQFPQFKRCFALTMMPGSSPGMTVGTSPSPPERYPDACADQPDRDDEWRYHAGRSSVLAPLLSSRPMT